jgi:hypothetical protein
MTSNETQVKTELAKIFESVGKIAEIRERVVGNTSASASIAFRSQLTELQHIADSLYSLVKKQGKEPIDAQTIFQIFTNALLGQQQSIQTARQQPIQTTTRSSSRFTQLNKITVPRDIHFKHLKICKLQQIANESWIITTQKDKTIGRFLSESDALEWWKILMDRYKPRAKLESIPKRAEELKPKLDTKPISANSTSGPSKVSTQSKKRKNKNKHKGKVIPPRLYGYSANLSSPATTFSDPQMPYNEKYDMAEWDYS